MAIRRGLYFSFDALVAAVIIIGAISMVAHTDFTNDIKTITADFEEVDSAAEDSVQLMMRSELSSAVNASEADELIATTNLSDDDLNRSVMEAIAILWGSGEEKAAKNLSESFLGEQLAGGREYRIKVAEGGNESVIFASSNGFEQASLVARSSRMVSGVSRQRASDGFTSRASLSSLDAVDSEYFFFGGYVGDGNITANMSLPDYENIDQMVVEGDAGSNFTITINDKQVSPRFNATNDAFRADRWQVCNQTVRSSLCSALEPGNNDLGFEFYGNASMSGGFIRIDYNQSYSLESVGDTYRIKTKRLPGINDVINLYDGFRTPGTLNSIETRLHFDSSAEIAVRIANATVYEGSGDQDLHLSNDTIHAEVTDAGLSYEQLSNTTVPFRLGVDELQSIPGVGGYVDAVGVTDVSGNMNANTDDGKKWDLAKNATELFIDIMGNASRSRAAINGFKGEMYAYHELTYDNTSLKNELDSWKPGQGTCVGCGILNMIGIQISGQNIIPVFDIEKEWRFTTETVASGWTEPSFDDSTWDTGKGPVGNGTIARTDTNQSDTYYLRTSFDYSPSQYRQPYLSLHGVGNVTAYINGEAVARYEEGRGHVWNGRQAQWANRTGLWHISDERAQTGNTSWYFGLPEVNHFATNEREQGTMTTPWLNLSQRTDPTVSFDQWLDIDGNNNRHIGTVEYDDGTGWTMLAEYTGSTTGWQHQTYTLPNTSVRVRFSFDSQDEVSDFYEGWYIDNVSIAGFSGAAINQSLLDENGNILALQYNATSQSQQNWTDVNDAFDDGSFGNTTVSGEDLVLESSELTGTYWSTPIQTPKPATWSAVETVQDAPDGSSISMTFGTNVSGEWQYYDSFSAVPTSYWYRYRIDIERNGTDIEPNVTSVDARWASEGRSVNARMFGQQHRYRSAIVLSAGDSNTETQLDNVETVTGTSAVDHSIEAACRAQENHDITVNAVNFAGNNNADAETELQNIADCGNGEYYNTTSENIASLYEQITKDILEASLEAQRVVVEGSVNDTLYPDSWIKLNYTNPTQLGFGEVRLTQESDAFGEPVSSPKNGSFYVPDGIRLADARVYTYSSQYWTDRAYVHNKSTGWTPIYQLWDYDMPYEDMGEPFRFQIPPAYLDEAGYTNVSIDAAENQSATQGGSPDSRVIYDIILDASVGYGDVYEKSAGGNTTYQSIYGPLNISVGQENDTWDTNEDAIDDAVDRLMGKVDVTDDGQVDVRIERDNINIDENSMSGLRWLWGPARVSVEVWEE